MKPFERTGYIDIELSNICPYSAHHVNCPLSHRKEPKVILPMKTIISMLHDMKDNGFVGRVGWNLYNEPLCDPRLYWLIMQAREILKEQCTSIFVLTNGFYLDQTLANEFEEVGVDWLRISCYSNNEYERITKIICRKMKFDPFRATLDDRLHNYTRPERPCTQACGAPLSELCVYSDGQVALCCLDYERRHVFGNVNTEPLSQIIMKGEMEKLSDKLRAGVRELGICRRCGMHR